MRRPPLWIKGLITMALIFGMVWLAKKTSHEASGNNGKQTLPGHSEDISAHDGKNEVVNDL